MADPTSTITRSYEQDAGRMDALIKTSEALVIGGMGAIALSTGLLEFMDDSDDLVPVGVILGNSRGLNDSLTGDATEKAVTRGGIILESVTVTGASAITDRFKLVYMSDGQIFTLTKPASGQAVGYVVDWKSSTTCDVYIFSPAESIMFGYLSGGSARYLFNAATINSKAMEGTSAITLATHTMQGHGKIVSAYHVCYAKDAGASAGSQTVNWDIGGTNLSGGVHTVAFGNTQGSKTAATAITGNNEFHDGDTLVLEMAASGTGFTSDQQSLFGFFAVIEKMPGG